MKAPHWVLLAFIAIGVLALLIDQPPDLNTRAQSGTRFRNVEIDQDAVHVIYWEKWNGFEGEAMQKVVDLFNERSSLAAKQGERKSLYLSPEGKPIFVHLLSIPDIVSKTLLAVSSGTPPDIAGLWNREIPKFAIQNALTPLDHWIERDKVNPEDYYDNIWEMCDFEGKVYSLPTSPGSITLYWNKERFREVGLDPERPPQNLEELMAYNEKLLEQDETGAIKRIGLLPGEPAWLRQNFAIWFGGSHVTPDNRTLLCDSKEWIEAWNWANDRAEELGRGALSVFEGGMGEFDSPQNPFISGKIAMTTQGVWLANFINLYRPSMEWGAAQMPFPANEEDSPISLTLCDMLVIPRGANNPEEAWRFVRFANTQEGLEILNRGHGKYTPLKKASKEFLTDHPHPYLKVFRELHNSPGAKVWSAEIPIWSEYNKECRNAFEKMWRLGNTPEGAPEKILKDLKKRLQAKLDQAWERIDARNLSKQASIQKVNEK